MVSYRSRKGKNGTHWYVSWRDADKHQRTKGGFTRKIDAEKWAAEHVIVAQVKGTYVDPQASRTLIGQLGEQWLNSHTTWSNSYTYSMRIAWQTWVEPQWAHRRLDSIRTSEIQAWVTHMGEQRSPSVVKRAYGILRGIYDMAAKDHLISLAPTQGVELPKKRKADKHIYTPTQLKAIAQASGEHASLVYVLGLCGLRWGEATALTVEDFDKTNSTLRINKAVKKIGNRTEVSKPKTLKSIRTVYLPQFLTDMLAQEIHDRKPTDLLFPNRHGGYLRHEATSDQNHGWLKTAMIKAGVPLYRAHDLRHTAASIAISSGANVYAVQRMLGHENASTTLNTYADLFEKDANNAAMRINATMQAL